MTDYITLQDLAIFMNADTLFEDSAEHAIAAAQRAVRDYTDQELTQVADDVVFLDGTGRDSLRLPERPVTAVTELLEDGVATPPGVYPDHDWVLSSGSGVVVRESGTWRVGRRNIKVTYDHGWDPDPVYGDFPADLTLATLSFARRIYEIWGSAAEAPAPGTASAAPSPIKSERMGDYEYTLADKIGAIGNATDFSDTEKTILDRYRAGGPRSGSKS